jgi:hypothetical protein
MHGVVQAAKAEACLQARVEEVNSDVDTLENQVSSAACSAFSTCPSAAAKLISHVVRCCTTSPGLCSATQLEWMAAVHG